MVVSLQRPSASTRSPSAAKAHGGRPAPPAAPGDELAERIAAAVLAAQAGAGNSDEAAALAQRMQFDTVLRQRAELDREMNALRDLAMEQVKRDDELLKKWIALI